MHTRRCSRDGSSTCGAGFQAVIAYVFVAAWIVAACWARDRYLSATGEGSLNGHTSVALIAVLATAVAALAIAGQRRLTIGPRRLVPGLVVGVVIGGVIVSCGVSLADALAALLLAAFLTAACRLSPRRGGQLAGAGVVVVAGAALVMWLFSWRVAPDAPLHRLSYVTQWRYAAALVDQVIIAVLLGALGAYRTEPSQPVGRLLGVVLILEAAAVLCLPILPGYFPITFLVTILFLCGSGWSALCELRRPQGALPVRGLGVILTVILAVWAWTPIQALGHAVLVAVFNR